MCTSAVFFVANCIVTLVKGCRGDACGDAPRMVNMSGGTVLANIATLAFSFSMVFAVFPVLEERVVNGDVAHAVARMKPAVRMSVVFSCCTYLLVGIAGVLAFGTATNPLALSNFPLANPLSQAIHLIIGVSATLLVAIISFPVIQSLELLIKPPSWARSDWNMRPWFVTVVGILAVIIDTYLPTKIAFALTGSLGLAVGAYVMPCMLFLKLDAVSSRISGGRHRASRSQRAAAVLVALFGCMLLFGSTPVTVWRLVHGDDGPAKQPLAKLLCAASDINVSGLVGF